MRRLGGPSATDSINVALSKALSEETAQIGVDGLPTVPAYNGSTVTWSAYPFKMLQNFRQAQVRTFETIATDVQWTTSTNPSGVDYSAAGANYVFGVGSVSNSTQMRSHGLVDSEPVYIDLPTPGAQLPTGLAAGQLYYVLLKQVVSGSVVDVYASSYVENGTPVALLNGPSHFSLREEPYGAVVTLGQGSYNLNNKFTVRRVPVAAEVIFEVHMNSPGDHKFTTTNGERHNLSDGEIVNVILAPGQNASHLALGGLPMPTGLPSTECYVIVTSDTTFSLKASPYVSETVMTQGSYVAGTKLSVIRMGVTEVNGPIVVGMDNDQQSLVRAADIQADTVSAPTAYLNNIGASSGDITITAPGTSKVRVQHNASNNAETVMTVPTSDDTDTAIAADRTYEVVTPASWQSGDPLQFRLRPNEYVFSAYKDGDLTIGNNSLTTIHGFRVRAEKNTVFNVNDQCFPSGYPTAVWQCPANGLYHIILEALFDNTGNNQLNEVELQTYVRPQATVQAGGPPTLVRVTNTTARGGTSDDYHRLSTSISTIRDLSTDDEVLFKAYVQTYNSSAAHLLGVTSTNSYDRSVIHIIRVG